MRLLAIISSSVGLIGQISHLMIVQNVSEHWAMGRSCIINKPWIIRVINAKKSQKRAFWSTYDCYCNVGCQKTSS